MLAAKGLICRRDQRPFGISTQYHPRMSPSLKPTARSTGYRSSSSARTAVTNLSAGPWQAAHLGSSAMGLRTPSFPPRSTANPATSLARRPALAVTSGAAHGFRRVGGIAQPVAGSPCRDTLFAADPLGDTVRIDVAGLDGQGRPTLLEPGVELPQQRVVHGRDDGVGASDGRSQARPGHQGLAKRRPNRTTAPATPQRARPTATPQCRTVVVGARTYP